MKPTVSTLRQFKRSIPRDKGCVTRYHFCKEKYPEMFAPGYDDGVVARPQVRQ